MESIIINEKEYFYRIERKSVKNINLRIKNDGVIYVSAPKNVPKDYILNLIKKNAVKYSQIIEKNKSNNKTDISSTKYLGKEYPVKIVESPAFKVTFDNDIFTVFTPDKNDRENILFLILKWKSNKCLEIYADINTRVCNLFRNAGYKVPLAVVTVKLMKTRWGSCNYVTGRFSMNLKLIDYPPECIYGVFCHEYMHFFHQDHSSAFYNDLLKICPDYKKYDKLLKA